MTASAAAVAAVVVKKINRTTYLPACLPTYLPTYQRLAGLRGVGHDLLLVVVVQQQQVPLHSRVAHGVDQFHVLNVRALVEARRAEQLEALLQALRRQDRHRRALAAGPVFCIVLFLSFGVWWRGMCNGMWKK